MALAGRNLKDHPIPPPAMGRDTFHHPRLLQAPSNLALDTARDPGAAPAALGTLCQGLPTLTGCPQHHPRGSLVKKREGRSFRQNLLKTCNSSTLPVSCPCPLGHLSPCTQCHPELQLKMLHFSTRAQSKNRMHRIQRGGSRNCHRQPERTDPRPGSEGSPARAELH